MKSTTCLLFGLLVSGLFAEPLTLINTLPTRPVFMLEAGGLTLTRTVAPGNRVSLEEGLFSGLGEKRVPLAAGSVYYLARFGALPALYRLDAGQVLIINQSGRAVSIELAGQRTAAGVLSNEAIALGALDTETGLSVNWDDGTSGRSEHVPAGVYRLLLDSPEGLGTVVSLIPWD